MLTPLYRDLRFLRNIEENLGTQIPFIEVPAPGARTLALQQTSACQSQKSENVFKKQTLPLDFHNSVLLSLQTAVFISYAAQAGYLFLAASDQGAATLRERLGAKPTQ